MELAGLTVELLCHPCQPVGGRAEAQNGFVHGAEDGAEAPPDLHEVSSVVHLGLHLQIPLRHLGQYLLDIRYVAVDALHGIPQCPGQQLQFVPGPLAAFSPIRGTQWSLVIQVPKADYGSYINGAILVAVSATFVVLLFSILAVLRLARSISRPVKKVTDRMVALSDGDLHTEVARIRTRDELELLTRTLGDPESPGTTVSPGWGKRRPA